MNAAYRLIFAQTIFIAKRVRNWLSVKPLFIEPGSPWENGYIESFNGKMRDECLAARSSIRSRRWKY